MAVEGPGFDLAVGDDAANAAVYRAEREFCGKPADAVAANNFKGVGRNLRLPLPGFDVKRRDARGYEPSRLLEHIEPADRGLASERHLVAELATRFVEVRKLP